MDQLWWKSFRLPAEDQTIPWLPGKAGIALLSRRLDIDKTGGWNRRREGFESSVLVEIDLAPVIDTSATQGLVIDPKPEPPNEMQPATGRGAKAGDVPCVRGDFGLEERNVEGRQREVQAAITNR